MTCLSIEHRRNVHGMISSAAHVHAFAQEAHPMQLQLCVGLHHVANRLARPCHHKSPMDLLSLQSNRAPSQVDLLAESSTKPDQP
jgi:PIN domain nuclease of toxin-antitoxin system